jgi:hypothetical protein
METSRFAHVVVYGERPVDRQRSRRREGPRSIHGHVAERCAKQPGSWSGIQLQDGTWIHASGLITFDANVLLVAVRGHVEPLCDALA